MVHKSLFINGMFYFKFWAWEVFVLMFTFQGYWTMKYTRDVETRFPDTKL